MGKFNEPCRFKVVAQFRNGSRSAWLCLRLKMQEYYELSENSFRRKTEVFLP